MDARTALDHVFLIAADGHISNEDGTYEHPWAGEDACTTCAALMEVQRLHATLGGPSAPEVPPSIELEPLSFPIDLAGEKTLAVSWEIDELQIAIIHNSDDLDFRVSGALELDALIELRDKMVNPAIAHHEERQRAEAIEAERKRLEWEAQAEQRAQQEAERERAQTFRGVSTRRAITENLTVHGRMCASLAAVRMRQTLGTVVMHYTPEGLIAKLPTAMTGRLNLRFCAKCKPIPNTQLLNGYLNGGTPSHWSDEMLKAVISQDIWEGHHNAFARDDERSED